MLWNNEKKKSDYQSYHNEKANQKQQKKYDSTILRDWTLRNFRSVLLLGSSAFGFVTMQAVFADSENDQTTRQPQTIKVDNIASYIEHTLLKADATVDQVTEVCKEAIEYKFAAVCVNPVHTALVAQLLRGTDVETCVVVGFPLGANTREMKVFEAVNAVQLGANSIDVVANIGLIKEKNYTKVGEELQAIKRAINVVKKDVTLKVIIECCLLTDEEKEAVTKTAAAYGVDFVKTSTGFSTGGATVHDVELMRKALTDYSHVKIKAAGGIRDFNTAAQMIQAGANRIGASSGKTIVAQSKNSNGVATVLPNQNTSNPQTNKY